MADLDGTSTTKIKYKPSKKVSLGQFDSDSENDSIDEYFVSDDDEGKVSKNLHITGKGDSSIILRNRKSQGTQAVTDSENGKAIVKIEEQESTAVITSLEEYRKNIQNDDEYSNLNLKKKLQVMLKIKMSVLATVPPNY